MADALQTHTIPNMIQGVSQQVAQQRRDTQAEAQFDCFNSPVEGAKARTSIEVVRFLSGKAFSNAHVFDILRDDDEHYLVVVLDGDLKVYDLADGAECTVTFPDGKAYLDLSSGLPKDRFVSTIVDDSSFIANKAILPKMGTTKSASRPQEAMAYVKAGAYSMTYTLKVTFEGTVYTWSYKTPDNSVVKNAEYIATDQIAATFYRALGGIVPSAGDTELDSTLASGSVSAVSLGFSVGLLGSVVHLWRTDGKDFKVNASDGAGDTYFIPIKDTVPAFSRLPARAIPGFVVKVKGSDASKDDDYYVSFKPDGSGFWEEAVAPDLVLGLDAATMPWQLRNTGYRTFEFRKAPWGVRVAGDADSSPEPSFIGKPIQDLFSDRSRLGIVIESGAIWSKSRNPYVWFPDTAQTILGTAPIDYSVMGGKRIALFRKAVIADESFFLWAQGSQYRFTSGSDPFKQDTVEAKLSAAYEFAEKCHPLYLGQSLTFPVETGAYASLIDLLLADGKIRGDTDITRHVPKYIPKGVRQIVGSHALGLMLVFTEGAPSKLYAYNWVVDGNSRIQSAWNTLRLPSSCALQWIGMRRSYALLLVQRPDGAAICRMDLTEDAADPGATWHIRADLRQTEAGLSITYDALSDQTTIVGPFAWTEAASDPTKALVIVRTSGTFARGYSFIPRRVTGNTIVVQGDARSHQLYVGLKISSERVETRFFVRTEQGTVPSDSLTVQDVVYSHAKTGYYRAEVTSLAGRTWKYEFTGRLLGDPENKLDAIPIVTGDFRVPIGLASDQYKLRLVNDSHLPSAWQSAAVHYQSTTRAAPPRRSA